MANTFGNMGFSLTSGFVSDVTGMGNNWLQKNIANGFKKEKGVKFYANFEAGGSVTNVLAKKLVGTAANLLKDKADRQLRDFAERILGRNISNQVQENAMMSIIEKAQINDDSKYGVMKVNGGANAVMALDFYGNKCVDAIMLGIPVKKPVVYSTHVNRKKKNSGVSQLDFHSDSPEMNFESDTLVWYDPTAIVSVNSDKNLLITKVQGRDYSRKELISNGDINFTVSGHILSNVPEVYPTSEVRKFIQVMQYKGLIKVNNLILDQFNIQYIVIKDFSLIPKEGYKSQQDYTFNAVGITPASEVRVVSDTISIIDNSLQGSSSEKSGWMKVLDSQISGIVTDATNAASQGLSIATGMLDGLF